MDDQAFAKFEFKMSLGRISYIAQGPRKPPIVEIKHNWKETQARREGGGKPQNYARQDAAWQNIADGIERQNRTNSSKHWTTTDDETNWQATVKLRV